MKYYTLDELLPLEPSYRPRRRRVAAEKNHRRRHEGEEFIVSVELLRIDGFFSWHLHSKAALDRFIRDADLGDFGKCRYEIVEIK